MKYYQECLRETKEAYDTLNSHGGYVDKTDTMGQMINASLGVVLAALEGYEKTLNQALRPFQKISNVSHHGSKG